MSVGQRVQFTKPVEVAASIIAHPSGILEITRHSDFHGLQKLFGPAKGINGHSDAEVMLYLLAVETGWFDKFTGRISEQLVPAANSSTLSQAYVLTIEAEFVQGDRFLMHARRGLMHARRGDDPRRLLVNSPYITVAEARDRILEAIAAKQPDEQFVEVEVLATGLGAGLFDLLKQEQERAGFSLKSRRTPFLAEKESTHSAPQNAADGQWQAVAIAGGDSPEWATWSKQFKLVPAVLDNGVARMPRQGEKPTGNALVFEKPTLRVTDAVPAARAQAAAESVASFNQQVENQDRSLRTRIALYADAIGVPTTKDGRNRATEDIVSDIFGRVSAGGEAAASDILPGRQALLAKLSSAERPLTDVIDEVLGACQRSLAIWMSRENFLRHKFRAMMLNASELLLLATPPDEAAAWIANRDTLLEAIQWIGTDFGSKNYHPSHDAEQAFEALHNGLGFKLGTTALTMLELVKVAIGRLRKAQPAPVEASVPPVQVAQSKSPVIGVTQSNTNQWNEAAVEFVAGGTPRPPWHSGTGKGTGVF